MWDTFSESPRSLSFTLKKPEACIFDKIYDFLFEIFDLQDIDLGSPKLHVIDTFNQATFNVILAFIGAELAGGRFCPLPWPVILNPIPGCPLSFYSSK